MFRDIFSFLLIIILIISFIMISIYCDNDENKIEEVDLKSIFNPILF